MNQKTGYWAVGRPGEYNIFEFKPYFTETEWLLSAGPFSSLKEAKAVTLAWIDREIDCAQKQRLYIKSIKKKEK